MTTNKKTSIGGQALLEGIMMRGPYRTAMAVRDPEGNIVLEEEDTKKPWGGKLTTIPVVRGIFNFISTLVVGYRALMRSADIAMPEEAAADRAKKEKQGSVFSGGLMVISVVLALVLAVGLFIWLPARVGQWLGIEHRLWRSLFEGGFRIVIFVGYLLLMTLEKDIRRTFQYHGAEHKTIFCYEHGKELTVENVRGESRFHPRCGTSFMILMLLVGVIISMVIPSMNAVIRTVIKIALLPLVVGIGYELIKLAGRRDNAFTRAISAPGVWLQHLTTLEPEDGMIECAIAAFQAVVPPDESDNW